MTPADSRPSSHLQKQENLLMKQQGTGRYLWLLFLCRRTKAENCQIGFRLQFVQDLAIRFALAACSILAVSCFQGCATRSSPNDGGSAARREFIFHVVRALGEHNIVVENVEEGSAKTSSFIEFQAALAKLTIGLVKTDESLEKRRQQFQQLLKTIDGLGKNGLEVREFIFIPSENHVVEFCGGKLTILPPTEKQPSAKVAPGNRAVVPPKPNK
jgi:hypothetical protein